MAVLHYVPRWLPLSEQFVHALVSRSRHVAVVVTPDRLQNVDVFPHQPLYSLGPVLERVKRERARRAVRTAALLAIAARHRIELVHVHFGYQVGDVVGLVRRRRLPLVLSLHGHDVTALLRQSPHHYDDARGDITRVVVPSRFLAGAAAAAGFDPDIVEVIPSGVDTAFFAPQPLPDGDPVVLFVGRLEEKKGVDVLLDAWQDVRRRRPDAVLRVLGYGSLAPVVASAGPDVQLVAPDLRGPRAQVRAEMRAAAVVVTPSRTSADGDVESLLLVNLEAQACGRPLVTTRHGGAPEFVDPDVTALVVGEGDAAALAEAMARVLDDRELAQRLAGAGPSWVERFEVSACVARVDELYRRLGSTATIGSGRGAT
jgi:glycosyltransferase involved in cell wall biosynthesis